MVKSNSTATVVIDAVCQRLVANELPYPPSKVRYRSLTRQVALCARRLLERANRLIKWAARIENLAELLNRQGLYALYWS